MLQGFYVLHQTTKIYKITQNVCGIFVAVLFLKKTATEKHINS